jgi:hypothetical protein
MVVFCTMNFPFFDFVTEFLMVGIALRISSRLFVNPMWYHQDRAVAKPSYE